MYGSACTRVAFLERIQEHGRRSHSPRQRRCPRSVRPSTWQRRSPSTLPTWVRHRTMPSSRRSLSAADSTASDNVDTTVIQPKWNTSVNTLPVFLPLLHKWLVLTNAKYRTWVQYRYVVTGRYTHARSLKPHRQAHRQHRHKGDLPKSVHDHAVRAGSGVHRSA